MPPNNSDKSQLTEILATAAHDLKNPLGAIFGYSDALLESSAGEGMTDKQKQVISKIRATTARTLELVRNYQQLFDLAQINLAKGQSTQMIPANCSLNTVVRTVVDNAWREDPSAQTLTVLLSREDCIVPVHRIQLDRVISNLLTNALRYTPRGGTITLSTTRKDSNVEFKIVNTGAVIPAHEISKLGTPHFRATTSTGVSGTGLGLYIVQQVVASAGGTFSCESSADIGTVFTVMLPLSV